MSSPEPERPAAAIDRLIHEPARLLLCAHLYVVEAADATWLVRATRLSWGNLAAHVKRLREAGYVVSEKEFREERPHTMLALTDSGRRAFEAYRERMRSLLAETESRS